MSVKVVGDSHSRAFRGVFGDPAVSWVGPVTMHRVAGLGWDRRATRRTSADSAEDLLAAHEWLVFGEIDVRCHLVRLRALTDAAVTARLAGAYLATAEALSAATGARPAVSSVVPASDASRNPDFPRHGSLAERKAVTAALNAALAEACLDRGVAFVDVFSRVSDASGGLRQDLTVDGLHLSGAAVAQLRAAAAAAGVL